MRRNSWLFQDFKSILVSSTGSFIKVHAKLYEKINLAEGEEGTKKIKLTLSFFLKIEHSWAITVYYFCTAVSYEVTSVDDKILWSAEASSTYNSNFEAKYVIDGTPSKLWNNKDFGALHSWLQIKMDQEHRVKGVKIGVRDSLVARQKFTEVCFWFRIQ